MTLHIFSEGTGVGGLLHLVTKTQEKKKKQHNLRYLDTTETF